LLARGPSTDFGGKLFVYLFFFSPCSWALHKNPHGFACSWALLAWSSRLLVGPPLGQVAASWPLPKFSSLLPHPLSAQPKALFPLGRGSPLFFLLARGPSPLGQAGCSWALPTRPSGLLVGPPPFCVQGRGTAFCPQPFPFSLSHLPNTFFQDPLFHSSFFFFPP
jgi:hypothetical protein